MDIALTPGIACGVIHNGNTALCRGFVFANTESQLRVTEDTIFGIGSITKGFTGAACGLLVSDGVLDWGTQGC